MKKNIKIKYICSYCGHYWQNTKGEICCICHVGEKEKYVKNDFLGEYHGKNKNNSRK